MMKNLVAFTGKNTEALPQVKGVLTEFRRVKTR